jgi:hypothetical protein
VRDCRLRNYQISIFRELVQVSNGYINRIAFINLVSNRKPEKSGFMKIKRGNPKAWIYQVVEVLERITNLAGIEKKQDRFYESAFCMRSKTMLKSFSYWPRLPRWFVKSLKIAFLYFSHGNLMAKPPHL